MTFMHWSADLDTGISIIDKQHRRIVAYINALFEARQSGDVSVIDKVLRKLVDYTLTHFAFEEKLLDEAEYPYVKAHRRVHQLFARKVGEYMTRAQRGEDIADEVLEMLRRWLLHHIREDDADYVDYASRVARIQALRPRGPVVHPAARDDRSFSAAVRRLFA